MSTMNNSRNRIASRGSGRLKPQIPSELSRSTKLPQISTSLASTEESNMSFWSPSRPPGYSVGVCSQQGKRPYQEDQFAIKQFVNTLLSGKTIAAETHMFGLFDGHAGGRCSTHLASNLANTLVEEDSFLANLPLALKRSFYTVNEQFLKIAEKNKWHDGSTGNVAVIRDGKLTVANVGDCRALLISNGRALQMSNDHKPTNPDEQKRIASLGGAVVYCMGVARVNKVLAVSRAFGNRTLRQVIRPDAELMQRELVPGDDFLVMASDGLWDVLRNKDVCDICYSSYLGRRPQAIADELVNMALARGSMDNVTCIVVNLADYRPPLPGNSLSEFSNPIEEAFSRNSGSSANTPSHHMQNRSLNISYGLQTESIADSQQLYEDDNGIATAMSSSSMQYSLNITRVRTAGNSSDNNSSHNNNNFYPAHEMPSKQRSLGTINPRDLPTLSSDSDPFGLKTLAHGNNNNNASSNNNNARVPFLKAVSTNSMSSQENCTDNGGNSTSFANLEKMPNPANGFLRPLTAIDAAPLPGNHNSNSHSSSNNSKLPLRNQSTPSDVATTVASLNATNHNGNNGNLSSSNNNSSSFNSNKLAQIRAIKNATSSNTSPSPFDAQSQSQPQPQPFQSQRALLNSRQNNVYNQSTNNGSIMNNNNNRLNLY